MSTIMNKTTKEPNLSWQDCYQSEDTDLFSKTRTFAKALARQKNEGHDLFRLPVLSGSNPHVTVKNPINNKTCQMLMFGSNSYLGFASDTAVVNASIQAAKKYGYGTGAVSLYAGTTDLHIELERRIAKYYGCEDAILFPTGYAANCGVISAICRPEDNIVLDLFCHASIYDGCTLSGAKKHLYSHSKMSHLEKMLKRASSNGSGTLIITDGVFSMDGDVAKLDEIKTLADKYGSRIMIDEAHALGVIGPDGKGTAHKYSLEGKVDITVGTLSKAPGGIGGYVTGSKQLVDYCRYYARSYFFSTSIPTPVIAGLIEVFNILESQPERIDKLWTNINHATKRLKTLGLDTGDTASAIIPIMINDEDKLKCILAELYANNIFMNYVSYPAVAKRRCRLRMSIMSDHSIEDIDTAINALASICSKYGIINRN